MNEERLKTTVAFLFVLITVLAVNNAILTSRITSRVLDSLKRSYVPGPYDPGFDPDKVPPSVSK
jgi:hypothetical protein